MAVRLKRLSFKIIEGRHSVPFKFKASRKIFEGTSLTNTYKTNSETYLYYNLKL